MNRERRIESENDGEQTRERKEGAGPYPIHLEFDGTVIPNSMMKNGFGLKSAELYEAEMIGASAFSGCTRLRSVRFGKLRRLGTDAFAGCSYLREAVFPDSLEAVGPRAFQDNKRMRRVVFPRGCRVKQLSSECFSGCEALEEAFLPGGVEEIGRRAFYKCNKLKEIELPYRLKRIGKEGFYQCGLRELELPEGLLEIGEGAFRKCRELEYVYLPDSLKKIGRWAFHGCSRLSVLEINHDPEIIGEWITNKNCTIRCPRGSRMEAYAESYGVRVEAF